MEYLETVSTRFIEPSVVLDKSLPTKEWWVFVIATFYIILGEIQIYTPNVKREDTIVSYTSDGSLMALGTQPFITIFTYHSILQLIGIRQFSANNNVFNMLGFVLSLVLSIKLGIEYGIQVAILLGIVAYSLSISIGLTDNRKLKIVSVILFINLCDKLFHQSTIGIIPGATIILLCFTFSVMSDFGIGLPFCSTKIKNVTYTHHVPLMLNGTSPMIVYYTLYEGFMSIAPGSLMSKINIDNIIIAEILKTMMFMACTYYICWNLDSINGRKMVKEYKKNNMKLRGWGDDSSTRFIDSYIKQLKIANVMCLWVFWFSRYFVTAVDVISVMHCMDLAKEYTPDIYREILSPRWWKRTLRGS